MREILEKVLGIVCNLSLVGSYCILLVLVARLVLRRAPRWCSYLLWGIVFLRLCCPGISADTDQPDPTAAGNGTDGEHRTDSIRRKSNLGKSDCGSNTDFRHDGAGRIVTMAVSRRHFRRSPLW